MVYSQAWLDVEKAQGGRFAVHGTPEEIKAAHIKMSETMAKLAPQPSDTVVASDGEVEEIEYRLYTPKGHSIERPLPVGIYTHGGGWMTGDLDSEDWVCRAVSEKASCIIISVDYRLTPEFQMPSQLNDTLGVYTWAIKNASSFGGDSTRFFTIGASASGAIALEVANQMAANPKLRDTIRGVAALVPSTLHPDYVPAEYESIYKSFQENATNVPLVDRESMETFYKHAGVAAQDSNVFTALATENHKHFPPVYFVSCEYDPLRDDSYVMEQALKNAGVPTRHDHYKGLPHYFWAVRSLPETTNFVDSLVCGVLWLFGQM
ncbi:uncharacterized protein N7479_009936 [Penicillium vulpinum]|uniref:Alpha/beta hydrolase fold-3 domain-containing protein n=1 Tax=Penicillium vulpinum TaxID=29845 RepID=A0A1V6RXU3_9EURO|nr:uncharacterized protein N7479_009936 [Penicillium vulpinum]KAJ5951523.1 hypothetical protein N7479_009936 [Penicillium vulpinum]OQE06602.1 hypothetical protein PENVUL_c017G09002 [Penicillium vulpinum]